MRYSYLLFLVLFAACGPRQVTNKSTASQSVASGTESLIPGGKLWSALYEQKAAEYQALCIQAYNIARLRLDEPVTEISANPPAIVTDIDETFLDNSPYTVHQALQGKDYEGSAWLDWTSRGAADTLSGALAFFQYAAARNIEVFYITNREEKERPGTLQNLQRYHFPYADNDHLIMRKDNSSKESRRQWVASTHTILLLLGDNLADFSSLFDSKSVSERGANVQALASQFGKRFIILPNANYGGWEDALNDNKHSWTLAQRDSIVRANLKNF